MSDLLIYITDIIIKFEIMEKYKKVRVVGKGIKLFYILGSFGYALLV